jgi:non-specific serine/threonine protein kinase/serine/threonine-protein kinase
MAGSAGATMLAPEPSMPDKPNPIGETQSYVHDSDARDAEPALAKAAPHIAGSEPQLGSVGPYRLLSVLGEGGMGTVFLAEQSEPVQRRVAVKLMRSSLRGKSAFARFDAERQALARLSHPNIATMLEAGTTGDGFPYFVMELVDGAPINTWSDLNRLSIRDRLSLFVDICRGVHHAHQKGIIHRDLKPSNVLVADSDNGPVVKVIDFGVAKAIDQPLTESTLYTGQGVVGTPSYMSPEALSGNNDDLDIRTDVYALGVLLYELLAGAKPHDTEGLAVASIIRKVVEEDGATPTTRFRRLTSDAQEKVAAQRQLAPATLVKTLTGDLSWIARKATARDREERYGSVSELAADVEHYLADEPVSATPPSLRYRTTKFVRRHRGAVAAVAIVVLTLIAGIAATSFALVRAKRAQAQAESASAFLTNLLDAADPWQQQKLVTVRDMLGVAAKRVPTELQSQPEVQAQLLTSIGSAYFHLNDRERAEPLLRQAWQLNERLYGAEDRRSVGALNDLALAVDDAGRPAEAEALFKRAIDLRRRTTGRDDRLARTLTDYAGLLVEQKRYDEARPVIEEAVAIRRSIGDPDKLSQSLGGLATLNLKQGRENEAERIMREAIHLDALHGRKRYSVARKLADLGTLVSNQHRFAEAEPLLSEAWQTMNMFIEGNDPRLGAVANNYGIVLRERGKLAEAEPILRRSLEIFVANRGADDMMVGHPHTDLGLLLAREGKLVEAEEHLQKALQLWKVKPGPDHEWTAYPLHGLGNVRREQHRFSEAEAYYQQSLAIRRKVLPKDAAETRETVADYAKMLRMAGREGDARRVESGR